MKKFLTAVFAAFLAAVPFSSAVAEQGAVEFTNDFQKDFAYYSAHSEEYSSSNWFYRYGEPELQFDMEYFAPQAKWQGIEPYCEVYEGHVHPGENDGVVIGWRSPGEGDVDVFLAVSKPYHDDGDGIAFSVYDDKLEQLFYTDILLGDRETHTFEHTLRMKGGEFLYFYVDSVGNNYFDTTNIDLTITARNFTPGVAAVSAGTLPANITGYVIFAGAGGGVLALTLAGWGIVGISRRKKRHGV